MSKAPYDKDHASRYDASRQMPPEMQEAWLTAIGKYLPSKTTARIIDIGSGTGRFAECFARELGAMVTGVEPSDEMRKIAESKRSSDRIRYLPGGAEKLPVNDERFDLAWLSMVIHHVEDRAACASETARVLDPGGIAIVRNSFRGRLDGMEIYKHFSGSIEIDENRLPSVEDVRGIYEAADLTFVAFESVRQTFAASFQAFADKVRHRGVSTLRLLSDDEFQKGLARIEEILKSGKRAGPVTEFIDMLIFKKN